ncbi:unnamed protein product [Vicia faba]|uniref:ubiquitinyl hydrolase 1 n=1 Tax=Vicia faba TaxID=3906 RepID=A0AAV0ZUY5_VICFA|nr:unnamed protein product [Vicia faba]
MMDGISNGGMLYHEVQESKLCAVHCINTVLQGAGDLFSHNVSLDGDFSIQVLQKALEVWDLQVIPLDSPVAEPAQVDPELENAFICHLQDHWFCIRKVNGEWYNFDSLYAAPQHLSKFYLAAYLDSLKGSGWSIFLVRGNFPKEFPISSSEASNGFGQWLLPEDAERITKSCNSVQQAPQQERVAERQQYSNQFLSREEAELFSDMEDEDLKAAIAASLMDSTSVVTNIAEASNPQNNDKQKSIQAETIEEASVPPSDKTDEHSEAIEAGALLNDKNNQQAASSLGGDNSQTENQNKENTL